MRTRSVIVLTLSIFSVGLLATAPAAHAEPPRILVEPPRVDIHAPTLPNAAKLPEFRVSKVVAPVPAVSPHTVQLAREHDKIAVGNNQPVPARLREAKVLVIKRDDEIAVRRAQLKSEIATLEAKANALENPMEERTVWNGRQYVTSTGPKEPTVEQLRQAAEGFVAAAQVGRVKAANFEQRLGEEQPDLQTTQARAEDYDVSSKLYVRSAQVLERLARTLKLANDRVGAQEASDKAQNTRYVARRYAKAAEDLRASANP